MAERITPRSQDFSQWYLDVIQHGKLADQSPVRGCLVLRPNGYALWEVVQRELDRRFKETGHRNAYFPLFIPESFLKKEKEHVEGFAPQCAVVTHGGGKKLDEPLVVRPTSETIINAMYAKWISSYRDLPLLINQWANVVRWEMRTRPFLRTLEFLWQEGHTCHESEPEARGWARQMLKIYQEFLENIFAIPVIAGVKSESEKFAGATQTLCVEAMMQDKKALQAATSHFFGTRFAEAFGIRFQDRQGKLRYVHQTSWGISTRIIGALIMTHSDDQGLVIPPRAAPTAVVFIPILQKGKDNAPVLEAIHRLRADLPDSIPSTLDDRPEHQAGFKFHEWEIQGAPLRVELGPRDLSAGQCVLARRDGIKKQVPLAEAGRLIPLVLEEFQKDLLDRARAFLERNRFQESDWAKFCSRIESEPGFYDLHWCGGSPCETQMKETTKATIRCIPLESQIDGGSQVTPKDTCIVCHGAAKERVIVARNY